MHLENFAEGGSVFHRMDPRAKIVGCGLFTLAVALCDSIAPLALALAMGTTVLAMAKLDTKQVFVRLLTVNSFVALLWVMLPLTTPGEVIASVGPFTIKSQGLELAKLITLKANAIITTTIALLGTSSIFALVHGLIHLKMSPKLVHLFFFCYRYISVIHAEYAQLRTAMKLRSFIPRTDLHTYRSIAYLLGMLFVRSHDRSQRIYQAMVLRGFSGIFWTLDHFRMRGSDWAWLIVFLSATSLVAVLQLAGE